MSDVKQQRSRPSFEEKWRQRFIKFAANDDDAGIAGWSPSGLEARFRNFSKIWPGDKEDAVWLDVGSGAGTYTRFLAGRRLRVIGMDYSLPTVKKARERAEAPIAWAVADVTRLPIEVHLLDGVLCFGVLQALERSEPAIGELTRVVKPGGQIWIDALNGWCLPSLWGRMIRWLKRRPAHLRYESPRRLRRLMEDRGCIEVRMYWVPILPSSMQAYQKHLETPLARLLLQYCPLAGRLLSHAFVLHGKPVSAAGQRNGIREAGSRAQVAEEDHRNRPATEAHGEYQ